MTTLLVIDKETNTRLLFKDEFQNEGYRVTLAETPDEGLAKIREYRPDIITLGIKRPGEWGLEFLKKIKEEESDIPVILCSAYAVYKNDFRAGVCDAVVIDSADLTELRTTIRLILSRRQSNLIVS